jgi:hypothetical protein|tara:strand:- start:775 stop:996 length:222 start_codon:yes stop_codon:yes gene_type:complete
MNKFITILILISSVTLLGTAYAATKYNPYTGNWETTNSDDELKYNPYSGSWGYEDEDSSLEYNPYSGKWNYAD